MIHNNFIKVVKNTKEVNLDLEDYLRASLESHKNKSSGCKGWDYLKGNLTSELKEILENQKYQEITYNSENVEFILNRLDKKLNEELKKQLGSFVYVWKDIRRDEDKKEEDTALKIELEGRGFKGQEIIRGSEFLGKDELGKLDGIKCICVLDVSAIGIMGSFDKKIEKKGKLIWSDCQGCLMFIPSRCRIRGYRITNKFYYKELEGGKN